MSILNEEDNISDITLKCDEYLVAIEKKSHEKLGWRTYIMKYAKNIYVLRFPGATRGRIDVDENGIITNVEIYDSEVGVCYKTGINEELKQFIGTKFTVRHASDISPK